LNVGDQIDVYVLRLDLEGRRIGLSLKRLQPNPWSQVDELYYVGQLVEGTVSRVTQFGAFVSLDPGIEALLHASQIADPAPVDPTLLLHEGQTIMARIISIEPHRQRLGLSIRDVDNGLELEMNALEEAALAYDDQADEIEAGASVAYTVESAPVEPPVAEEESIVD
jgi:small subunit ribosomal protein S1